ncbi:OsmC family protein [Flavobacterium amniphilum]|uniref:OsmC family protein n=1 Tax=Flavobacterium amniphilum TaxID=1834035 RepID=UPI00202A4ACB|nr:OsmC family protein [Flavobacterium amniphilum]MCL9806984.1 OsmC family protein [Flavobacterium amniphilum]
MQNVFEKPIIASIGQELYKVTIQWRNGVFIADEPFNLGGKDTGPDPYTLLLASLASCTLSTLRMYIDRKKWQIPELSVEINVSQSISNSLITEIKRDIRFKDFVSQEKKERLFVIAKKCPISKLLENHITINTTI